MQVFNRRCAQTPRLWAQRLQPRTCADPAAGSRDCALRNGDTGTFDGMTEDALQVFAVFMALLQIAKWVLKSQVTVLKGRWQRGHGMSSGLLVSVRRAMLGKSRAHFQTHL